MTAIIITGIIAMAVLGILLWDRLVVNRKLTETNLELLKRIPVTEDTVREGKQLTPDGIAEAVRFNGYIPEKDENSVTFRIQGESYLIDAERLPLFFVVKSYSVDPGKCDMDLMREAAHIMSDKLVMVKASFFDDDTTLSFFVAAQDRNYESLKESLPSYLRVIDDGQHLFDEEYDQLVKEKEEGPLASQPFIPPVQQENKVLS